MIKKFFKTFFLLMLSYLILMTLSYSIPNNFLEANQQESLSILDSEGHYPSLSKSDSKATMLDNYTDRLMIDKSKKGDTPPLRAAMLINGYPRYWHGYQALLRPLLVFMSYGGVRQLYGFIIMLLLGLNMFVMAKKKDFFFTISFFISFYFVRFFTFFLSMQFSNVFILMLLFNLFILTRKSSDLKNNTFILAFFIIGSLTNFVDLLTTPLVTLGVPLLTLLYSKLKLTLAKNRTTKQYFLEVFLVSLFWGLGYGLTWGAKWVLSSIILRKNIILDAFKQAVFRTEGNQDYPLDRIYMFKKNIGLILNNFNFLIFIMLVCFVIVVVILKRKVNKPKFDENLFYLLVIGSLPYFWYFVMSNHSQIHYYFTYRNQIVTVFSLLSFLSFIVSELLLDNEENMKAIRDLEILKNDE